MKWFAFILAHSKIRRGRAFGLLVSLSDPVHIEGKLMLKLFVVGAAMALLGCGKDAPKPLGQLHYKISGTPGTLVLVEYYGTAVRPGDRRFARDLIVREVTLPTEGFVRFWGAAEADGIAMMRVLNKDPNMKSCVDLAIQIDDRSIKQAEACLKSYTTELSATVPSARA